MTTTLDESALEVPGIYEHYKGGLYQLLHHARLSNDCSQRQVVYLSLLKGVIWVRPQEQWSQLVAWRDGQTRERFHYVGERVPGIEL